MRLESSQWQGEEQMGGKEVMIRDPRYQKPSCKELKESLKMGDKYAYVSPGRESK